MNVISPAVPAEVGVAIPTVSFLETVASPCKNRDDASIPLVEDDVTLLVKTTGPLNSEIDLLPSPPVTLIDDEKSPSVCLDDVDTLLHRDIFTCDCSNWSAMYFFLTSNWI